MWDLTINGTFNDVSVAPACAHLGRFPWAAVQDKKKAEEEKQKELNALFAVAIKQPKVPAGEGRTVQERAASGAKQAMLLATVQAWHGDVLGHHAASGQRSWHPGPTVRRHMGNTSSSCKLDSCVHAEYGKDRANVNMPGSGGVQADG